MVEVIAQFQNITTNISNLTNNNQVVLRGQLVDKHTRCQHYHSKLDIIAIKYKCCREYYPCFKCHQELAEHKSEIFNKFELYSSSPEKVILCGNCYSELTFKEYSGTKTVESDSCEIQHCIQCKSLFNPKCSLHYDIYFDL
ncbi:uncharacterized protein RJT21DRAFT_14676 [Scheffersomyces amazonensis]|uniref:uncharacterized protein n=1 Tax=Scheffersomyces amazonensis TaxID=1078765 RepID=UPI00315D247A